MNTKYTYLGGPVAHFTPGVRLRDCSRQFTILLTTICNERHLRTPSVRISTVPQGLSRSAHLGCEYTNCTYLGNPVAHCTLLVRLRDRSRQFTLPCITICSELHFRTPSVTYLYSSPSSDPNSSLTLCQHLLYLTGWSSSALYTRCTIPRPFTAVHHTMDYSLQ